MAEPSDGIPSPSYRDDNQDSIVNLVAWVFTITAICTIIFVLTHKMYTQRRKWPHVDEILLIFTGVSKLSCMATVAHAEVLCRSSISFKLQHPPGRTTMASGRTLATSHHRLLKASKRYYSKGTRSSRGKCIWLTRALSLATSNRSCTSPSSP